MKQAILLCTLSMALARHAPESFRAGVFDADFGEYHDGVSE